MSLLRVPGILPSGRRCGRRSVRSPNKVLDALRADNWLHAHGDPSSAQGQRIKAQILGAFYIDTDIWRGMVLGQSLMAVRQAINGLNRANTA